MCSGPATPTLVSAESGSELYPRVVYDGSGYGLAWIDTRHGGSLNVYFRRLDASGAPTGTEQRMTPSYGSGADVAWDSGQSNYAVVWVYDRNVYVQCLSSSGVKIGSPIQVTSNTSPTNVDSEDGPVIVSSGSQFGIAWSDNSSGSYQTYFQRVYADNCATFGSVTDVSAQSYAVVTDMTWGDGIHAIVYRASSALYLTRLNASGTKQGSDLYLSDFEGNLPAPSIAYDNINTEFGVAWDRRDASHLRDEIYFTRVNTDGTKLGDNLRVSFDSPSACEYPSIAWSGSHYGISWRRGGTNFVRVDRLGNVMSTEIALSPVNGLSSVASDGSLFTVVWTGDEMRSSQVTCP